MAQQASPLSAVLAALPAVQDAVRNEIAARIAAGEAIAGVVGEKIVSRHPVTGSLAERRRELLERHAMDSLPSGTEHKFIA